MKSGIALITGALTLSGAMAQKEQNTDRIERILRYYEPYTLSVNTELTEALPHIGLDRDMCMAFLIEGTKNRVGTALHCLKDPQEVAGEIELVSGKLIAKTKKIPYTFTVEGKSGRIVCRDPDADIAILEVPGSFPGKIAPKIPTSSIAVGTTYTSILSNREGGFTLPRTHQNYKIKFPTRIFTEGKILSVQNGMQEDQSTGKKEGIPVEYLFTDTSPKGGFSGGPLLTENGELLGIWSFMDGAFGAASSITNLKKLLESDECK